MTIGLDGVAIDDVHIAVDLATHKDKNEKYVYAVDSKIDVIITDNEAVAQYFKANGIVALLKV